MTTQPEGGRRSKGVDVIGQLQSLPWAAPNPQIRAEHSGCHAALPPIVTTQMILPLAVKCLKSASSILASLLLH